MLAATNKNLEEEIAAGRFRADLYYRVNVIAVEMPPLRERKDDIPLLVEYFFDKHRFTAGSPPAKVTDEAMEALERHHWPGNVRELENTIERATVLAQGGVVTSRHLLLSSNSSASIDDCSTRR